MFRKDFPIYFLIIICLTFVKTERILVRNSAECNQELSNTLNTVLSKLHDLELKIDLLTPHQRQGNWRDTQRKFLDSQLSRSSVAPLAAPTTFVRSSPKCHGYCSTTGIVKVKVGHDTRESTLVCDDNNWLLVANRFDGSVKFHNKNWAAYKSGFGEINTNSEFFIGLEKLHAITASGAYELLFKLIKFDGEHRTAKYSGFSVGDEQSGFRLYLDGFMEGDAGDSFSYHAGQSFTTVDRDNDAKQFGNCGEEYNSAGWFKQCMEANIFGAYTSGPNTPAYKEGIYWDTFIGPESSLKGLKILIRPQC